MLGVVDRVNLASMSDIDPLEDVEDVANGRLGVKDTGLVGLVPAGVLGTAMEVVGVVHKLNSEVQGRFQHCTCSIPDYHLTVFRNPLIPSQDDVMWRASP